MEPVSALLLVMNHEIPLLEERELGSVPVNWLFCTSSTVKADQLEPMKSGNGPLS